MNGPGYEVTPQALADAARGIEDVLAGLRSFGSGVGRAEAGRGVALLAAGTGPVGHERLAHAFTTFCVRWDWGVRAVVRAGRETADGLADCAASYDGIEQAVLLAAGDPTPGPAAPIGEAWAAVARDVAENSGPGMIARALRGENPFQGRLDDVADLRGIVD